MDDTDCIGPLAEHADCVACTFVIHECVESPIERQADVHCSHYKKDKCIDKRLVKLRNVPQHSWDRLSSVSVQLVMTHHRICAIVYLPARL